MQRKSIFERGMDKLKRLNQKDLNTWVKDYFKYNYDRNYFGGGITDSTQSVSITLIIEAIDLSKTDKFKIKLQIAICKLLKDISIFKPDVIYEIVRAIVKNKMTQAADKMICLINSGELKKIKNEGIDFHFIFLKSLSPLYQNNKLGKQIIRVLEDNVRHPKYRKVCQVNLTAIKKMSDER